MEFGSLSRSLIGLCKVLLEEFVSEEIDMRLFLSINLAVLFVTILNSHSIAQTEIYWGNDVPKNWNGDWAEELRTPCEQSRFRYTATNQDTLDYFSMLVRKSENVQVFNMFVSDRGRSCPVLVMSHPRISSPAEARKSGKTVVYLQGGIHSDECEGKEALFFVIRDILFGKKKYLMENLVILVCPNFNVDGNETRVVNSAFPSLTGIRKNAAGFDVNRDAIKLETLNMQGAYKNVFNTWDPTLIFDTHRMGGARHGYAIAHAGSNVVAASAKPRDYVTYNMFPRIVKRARNESKIEIGMHCGLDRSWPPTVFSHDNAIWSTEAKFMVSGYGLRNRMAILVETPGGETFEKAIYSQYAYTHALLDYAHENGKDMQDVCRKADEELVRLIKEKASSGKLKNYVKGKYVSEGKVSVYAYKDNTKKAISGTSLMLLDRPNPPKKIENVNLITKPVGVKEAMVPRAYVFPAQLKVVAEKLRMHGVKVTKLGTDSTFEGQQFVFSKMSHKPMGFARYPMTTLKGKFENTSRRFPAGSYHVDMAQPLANVIFYAVEPQVRDGLLGWNLMDEYLKELGANKGPVAYPIFKSLRRIK